MNLKIKAKAINENSRNYVYEVLKSNILEFNLLPGESISEVEISKLLNFSRTPIREAFMKLSEEQLIDIFPQKGSFISLLDMDLIHEGIFMREHLEIAIYKEAAVSFPADLFYDLKKTLAFQEAIIGIPNFEADFLELDNQFHSIIFEGMNKLNIWNRILSMNSHGSRLRYLDLLERESMDKIFTQHDAIIRLIENHDSTGVEELVHQHLNNIMTKMGGIMEKYKEYFKTGQ